ncbi:indole-3-glycerol phosphate synthase TrpC [Dysgonomonas macrotermitis]|uniref:indole-3-glycerol-phosphate synthase n=1 Tax=Dysgonomonas macrotermitis TaxID=1346286 RepID=A0A1M5AWX8_9BACT|nr:indole-3-glycerol phosphate synthase TrpC [Dysgonomonas macrotermitis]SHF34748.1 indole-3-glycerol phosphate synthase [Dysgonomonas macrotermitis]
MTNILDKIVANKRKEIEQQKKGISIDQLAAKITNTTNLYSFKESLANSLTGIIAEFKRKSPSRGWIFENAKIQEVIPYYSQNGASAISVLTDTEFFGGTFADLELARSLTRTPLLRKDFMVDEYQIYQAKLLGANAILLIAASLTIGETKQFAVKARELGLDVLLEIHNEKELGHINEYVDVVGVNNRDLTTFITDVKGSFDLAEKIPSDFLKISESGISKAQTVRELREVGYRGFLMGENFMKTDNPGLALKQFIEELKA